MLEVGFGKSDITPEIGCYLAGNGDFPGTRVNDPLYARAMVLRSGSVWVALVSCDLLGINEETVTAVRSLLCDDESMQTANILISCTHTHNGPNTRFLKKQSLKHRNPAYMERLASAIAAAIRSAHAALRPATLTAARGTVLENFNRRLITADGNAHFYNPRTIREHPEYAALTTGVTDNEVGAIQFRDSNGHAIATIVNYAAHPLTVSPYSGAISADFCGVVVNELERATGAPAIFFQGACGDLHSKGLFAGFRRQQEMGQNIAAEVLRVLGEPSIHCPDPTLSIALTRVELPIDEARAQDDTWIEDYVAVPFLVEMAAVQVGPVTLVTLPGEVTCEIGLQIKWNSPFRETWLLYNCNEYTPYIVYRRAYFEGGYETGSTCFTPDAGDRIIATALGLCRSLQP